MHAAVLAGFPDDQPNQAGPGRVLWRLDNYGPQRVLLFVASPDKPDFTHIVEQAGWPTTQAWDTRSYDGLLDSLRPGQQWQFRLTANPVHHVRLDHWGGSKPLGHVTVAQQQQWLLDRAQRHGFRIVDSAAAEGEPDVAVVDRAVRRFSRNGSRVTLSTATFEGHLTVEDAAALRRSMTSGIGRAKSYGCGLLTLARGLRGGSS